MLASLGLDLLPVNLGAGRPDRWQKRPASGRLGLAIKHRLVATVDSKRNMGVNPLCYTSRVMLFIHKPTSAAFAPVCTHREDRGAWPWRQPT